MYTEAFRGLRGEREKQIASLAAQGLRTREICDRLLLSEPDVEASLAEIFSQLDVSNRVELILYALTHRLPD